MSQTINGNVPIASIPPWMMNIVLPYGHATSHDQRSWDIVHPSDSFESEIVNKLGPYPHYPGPIHNLGGLHIGSHCRIPGVQPFVQSILRPQTCIPHCLTKHCYEYGNTRFPPNCECNDKYDCRSYGKCYSDSSCGARIKAGGTGGNCSPTCGTCNHNSSVINY